MTVSRIAVRMLALVVLAACGAHAQVVINEIHYHPPDPFGTAEFVELFNAGATAVDLGGYVLDGFAATPFEFPPGSAIAPGGFVVVAGDAALLKVLTAVPDPVYQWPAGSLSNGGEALVLKDAGGAVLDQLTYDDFAPWPGEADGAGPSLERVHPTLPPGLARSWRAAAAIHGSPGAANSAYDEAPFLLAEEPARGAVVGGLSEILLSFHEPVTGVTAADLTVNGVAATAVSGLGAGPYAFSVVVPAAVDVEVVLAPGAIQDADGHPFHGDTWQYIQGLPRLTINEIHYRPPATGLGPDDDPENLQFLELFNADVDPVDLSGFEINDGITHRFASGPVLDPGAFLVLARDPAFLRATLPSIPVEVPVLAWDGGNLSNGGETVTLGDAFGNVVDRVAYDDDPPWDGAADGDGPSLELVNPGLPNHVAPAWGASLVDHGTPGTVNSRFLTDAPALLLDPLHQPPIPAPGQPLTITVTALDDGPGPPTVTLYHRKDQASALPYQSLPMLDDGLHGDGAAGDSVFGATVPGLGDEHVLDFYIEADDGQQVATAPAAHVDSTCRGNPCQTFLAKFSSEVLPSDLPVYHIIITADNAAWQPTLTGPSRKRLIDATFIDDAGNIHYNVTQRYRGGTSLLLPNKSFHVNFPDARPLDSVLGFPVTKLVLNANNPVRQKIGYDFFRDTGLPSSRTAFVRLRLTGANFDERIEPDQGFYGAYVVVEHVDNDYLDSQNGLIDPDRGLSRDGNLYWCHNTGDLSWQGTDPAAYDANLHDEDGYQKINNETEYQWDDLIHLVDVLNNTAPENYVNAVQEVIDLDQWIRWFAVHNTLANREGGIWRDFGDDYYIVFDPVTAPPPVRARMLPWDMDSVLHLGPAQTIWRTSVPAVAQILRHNAFAPIFVKDIRELADGWFSLAAMEERLAAMPDAAFRPNYRDSRAWFLQFISDRLDAINLEIVSALSLGGVPTSPYAAADPLLALAGTLNQAGTHAVLVNEQPAVLDVFQGTWSFDFTLLFGRNDIVVRALDRAGVETERQTATVIYDPPGSPECSVDINCNDDNACTIDSCDEGVCSLAPLGEGAACDDGLDCTAGDACSAGACMGVESCPTGLVCGDDGACGVPTATVQFQDDGVTYFGTHDTFVVEWDPSARKGQLTKFEWDTSAGAAGLANTGLLRFEDLIGDEPGKVPPGATLAWAGLTLTVFDPSVQPAGAIHLAASDWDEATTHFNNFGPMAGVGPEDIGDFIAAAPVTEGVLTVNVTAAVQGWVDAPASNRGLIFLPNSPDDLEVRSSEYGVIAERPRLTVEYYDGCQADTVCFDGSFCNGEETCEPSQGCLPGVAPSPDDGVSCTLDRCDDVAGAIVHTFDEAACGQIELFMDDAQALHWVGVAGVDGWNVYTGDLYTLRAGGPYTQPPGSNPNADRACLLTTPEWSDPWTPAEGEPQFFLVSAVAGGIEGALGSDSSTTPRTRPNPCS